MNPQSIPIAPLRLLIAFAAATAPLMAAAVEEQDLLDGVTWSPASGQPTTLGVAGRAQITLIVDPKQKGTQDVEHFMAAMSARYALETTIHFKSIFVKPDPYTKGSPYLERAPESVDDGTLLHAFAVDQPGVILITDDEGRLTTLAPVTVDLDAAHDALAAGWRKSFAAYQPLIPSEGSFPKATPEVHDAMEWYIAGDTRRVAAVKGASDAFMEVIRAHLPAMVKAESEKLLDAKQPGLARIAAELRLKGLIADYPDKKLMGEAIKAVAATKSDAALTRERAGLAAFHDYLKQMKPGHKPVTPVMQAALLKDLIAKNPGTYAAEVAKLIAAFGKLTVE